jgi:hypothetical protein
MMTILLVGCLIVDSLAAANRLVEYEKGMRTQNMPARCACRRSCGGSAFDSTLQLSAGSRLVRWIRTKGTEAATLSAVEWKAASTEATTEADFEGRGGVNWGGK